MIQPVDWTETPDSLKEEVNEERRRLYEVIWNAALAVTLKPPVLTHERLHVGFETNLLAIASVTPAPTRKGYWRFRQDYPAAHYPVAKTMPAGAAFSVKGTLVVRSPRSTLGHLILEMEKRSIGTPATIADLLKAAVQPDNPQRGRIALESEKTFQEPGQRWIPQLSPRGKEDLKKWEQAGLIPDAISLQNRIDQVASGDSTPLGVLSQIATPQTTDVVTGLANYIAQQCDRWRGLSQEDGLRAIAKQGVVAPRLRGLPAWIDPEKHLPADHQLRAVRQLMEEALVVSHPTWTLLDPKEQAEHRANWLRKHRLLIEGIPEIDAPDAQFNALIHWLTGGLFTR